MDMKITLKGAKIYVEKVSFETREDKKGKGRRKKKDKDESGQQE